MWEIQQLVVHHILALHSMKTPVQGASLLAFLEDQLCQAYS